MLFKSKSKYDFIIVGLGNPGDKYEQTRHNAGFRTVDVLAKELNATNWKNKFQSLIADAEYNGKTLLLVKPLTFMNKSGEAVSEIVRFYKIEPQNVLVISDDISMDAGRLRLRASGSHGGHNGLKDIIELLGTDAIPRIKVGMGQKPHPDYDLAAWVLSHFTKDEAPAITKAAQNAAAAALLIADDQMDKAMNEFSR